MKQAIGVIGQGFVGGSVTQGMCHAFDVYTYDIAGVCAPGGIKTDSLADLVERVDWSTGVFFVCLPTPMKSDGSADLSIIDQVIRDLAVIPGRKPRVVVLKSTVPPGTTSTLNTIWSNIENVTVIFNPEFLTEANAVEDFKNQNRIILGGPRPQINLVKQIYEIAYPNVPIIKTSSSNAEMIKYVTNCFLAVKLSFANEIYQLCGALKELDIDYDKVIEYAKFDPRLGNSHWSVPSRERDENGNPLMGWGGHCFPKDINALMKVAKDHGVDPKVMRASWEKNLEVRTERDWEKMKGRAVSE